jgi:DNA-directed RNA polymerase subunit K/omega
MPRRKTSKKTETKVEETKKGQTIELTRFEKARLIGLRALQIAQGSPILVDIDEETLKKINYDPIKIAEMELEKGVLPLKVERKIPIKPKIKFV